MPAAQSVPPFPWFVRSDQGKHFTMARQEKRERGKKEAPPAAFPPKRSSFDELVPQRGGGKKERKKKLHPAPGPEKEGGTSLFGRKGKEETEKCSAIN